MIRVMVVEDEAPIRRSISHMIEQQGDIYQVRYQAKNGKESLEYLAEGQIDLVFLDIQMPVMDGLAALEEIKKRKLDVPVIILSGYQDFEYVRKAMRCGACDYLLKPLKTEELEKVLRNVTKTIISNNLQTSQIEPQLFIPDENHVISKKQDGQKYDFAMCYFGSYNIDEYEMMISKGQRWEEDRLEQFLAKQLDEKDYWLIKGKCAQERMILFRHTYTSRKPQMLLEEFLKQKRKKDETITIALEEQPVEMKDIYQVQIQLRWCIKHKMLIDEDHFIYFDSSMKESMKVKTAISADFGILSFSEQIFEFVCKKIEQQDRVRYRVLQAIKISLLMCSEKFNSNYNYQQLEESVNSIMQNTYSMEYLYAEIKKLIIDAFYDKQKELVNKEKTAYEIKSYLEEHFNEHISNQDLAERYGFVPSYIRAIFQQYFGESPMAYIQRYRIEKSKEWLSDNLSVSLKDVAEALGFSDQLYFSKVFKKQEGIAPSEYKKREEDKKSGG